MGDGAAQPGGARRSRSPAICSLLLVVPRRRCRRRPAALPCSSARLLVAAVTAVAVVVEEPRLCVRDRAADRGCLTFGILLRTLLCRTHAYVLVVVDDVVERARESDCPAGDGVASHAMPAVRARDVTLAPVRARRPGRHEEGGGGESAAAARLRSPKFPTRAAAGPRTCNLSCCVR